MIATIPYGAYMQMQCGNLTFETCWRRTREGVASYSLKERGERASELEGRETRSVPYFPLYSAVGSSNRLPTGYMLEATHRQYPSRSCRATPFEHQDLKPHSKDPVRIAIQSPSLQRKKPTRPMASCPCPIPSQPFQDWEGILQHAIGITVSVAVNFHVGKAGAYVDLP
jgi:hypothetical protein